MGRTHENKGHLNRALADCQAQVQALTIENGQLKDQVAQLQDAQTDQPSTKCDCPSHCPDCGARLRTLDLGEVM